MGLEEIVPAIFLIAVLVLVLPAFISTNSELKQFLKNISLWSVIVATIVLILYLILWWKKLD